MSIFYERNIAKFDVQFDRSLTLAYNISRAAYFGASNGDKISRFNDARLLDSPLAKRADIDSHEAGSFHTEKPIG